MSPVPRLADGADFGVPRASGDEPALLAPVETKKACSPRERG